MFFEKLNFYFSKKAKLVTFCHHLGKARVKVLFGAITVNNSLWNLAKELCYFGSCDPLQTVE